MKISCVPEIINSESVEIRDENFVLIEICPKSIFKFNKSSFKNPTIIIDNFNRLTDEVEIKRINVDELDKLGYRIVSIPATSKTRNYSRQTKIYVLENKNNTIGGAERLAKVPKDHFVELDIINKRLRIFGKNACNYVRGENASSWVELQ
jgi:hypothetical protein